MSEEIIDEYAEVLARPKFAFPQDEIEALIAMLRGNGELFQAEQSSQASACQLELPHFVEPLH